MHNLTHEVNRGQYDSEARKGLAILITNLLDLWGLTKQEQAYLLGVAARSTIYGYAKGTAISNARDEVDRVGHLLAIHKALKILLPENAELAYAWPTTKNKFFNNRTPVEVIIQDGFEGLLNVRYYLENQLVS